MQGGEGRGSPGEAAPGAGALAWRGSSPAPPSAFGAPRSAADGRRGTLEAKVHPEVGVSVARAACRISHLHRCAILTAPLKTTAGCSFTAAAGPGCCGSPGPPRGGHQSKRLALASELGPAGCHRRRVCPGWLVTQVWLNHVPEVTQCSPPRQRSGGRGATAAEARLLPLPDVYACVCMYVFIYFIYV